MKRFLSSLKGAKPETRFFISLWFRFFAPEDGISLPVAEIAKMFGVSKNVVVSSLAYMTAEGFFEKSHMPVKVGRPSPRYFATNKLLAILSEDEQPRFHAGLIEELYSNSHQHLTLSNRLLLCVFLLHANEYGLVESLGASVIAQMTGMSNDQFNSQLDKLTKLRYARRLCSGVTSKVIFGARPSIYLLDITNERFSSAIFRSVTCEEEIHTVELRECLEILIKYARNGLYYYRKLLSDNQASSKAKNTELYTLNRNAMIDKTEMENAESSWVFFIKLGTKPALKHFLLEKILLSVAQFVISRIERNQESLRQLSFSFFQQLQPVFLKQGKMLISEDHAHLIDKNATESHLPENELSYGVDLIDTPDLTVFAEILVRLVILPEINMLKYKINILEKHFKAPFQFTYLLEEKKEGVIAVKPPRDIYCLYPITRGPYAKRVYINNGEVYPLDIIADAE